jgi:hypothetical protein
MFRRLIPLVVALGLVVGCEKRSDQNSSGGGDGKIDSDPNAAYTLKLREEEQGDRAEVTVSGSGSSDLRGSGKIQKQNDERRFEYTQSVIELKAGDRQPTKLTRTYKTARGYDPRSNSMKALPYEGKTVTIEKKGPRYEFTADGKQMTPAEIGDLVHEFPKPEKTRPSDLIPKNPVKIGELWTVDAATLKKIAGDVTLPLDLSRSRVTGNLARAYTKDGKQWGVIALNYDLVVDSGAAAGGKPQAGGTLTGTLTITGTIEAVIDGSTRDGTTTMTVNIDVTAKGGPAELKRVDSSVQSQTVKTVK